MLKGTFKLNNDTTLWGELVMSRTDLTAQFAPPSQPLGIGPSNAYSFLYDRYVTPFLNANNLDLYNFGGASGPVHLGYRPVSVGGRADDYQTDARHFAVGVDGLLAGWNYKAGLTLSHALLKDIAAGGYLDSGIFNTLAKAGTVDPLMGTGGDALQSALLNGSVFSKTYSDVNNVHLGAQHDLFELAGGASILSLGADYSTQHYSDYGQVSNRWQLRRSAG
jgi:iron complex outermembrane receptor protein